MKIPEEKKPEMAPKDVGSNMCAVAMCTETAKRNLIKHKFEASVCPYHYRFVYALPYIHRCQYLKSVVDEVVLGAYVLHFQPGNSWPTAQLLPGSNTHSDAKPADDLVCCDNRATRVVLVGDKLNHCKVYLFCHGHNAQVRTQACGFDAKPSTAKNEVRSFRFARSLENYLVCLTISLLILMCSPTCRVPRVLSRQPALLVPCVLPRWTMTARGLSHPSLFSYLPLRDQPVGSQPTVVYRIQPLSPALPVTLKVKASLIPRPSLSSTILYPPISTSTAIA